MILSPVLGKLPRPARPDPKRFANVISMARYRELLTCAPGLKESDYENLKDFWPKRPKLGQLVAIACAQMGCDWDTICSAESEKTRVFTPGPTTGSGHG